MAAELPPNGFPYRERPSVCFAFDTQNLSCANVSNGSLTKDVNLLLVPQPKKTRESRGFDGKTARGAFAEGNIPLR
jgi:hypothetical protein